VTTRLRRISADGGRRLNKNQAGTAKARRPSAIICWIGLGTCQRGNLGINFRRRGRKLGQAPGPLVAATQQIEACRPSPSSGGREETELLLRRWSRQKTGECQVGSTPMGLSNLPLSKPPGAILGIRGQRWRMPFRATAGRADDAIRGPRGRSACAGYDLGRGRARMDTHSPPGTDNRTCFAFGVLWPRSEARRGLGGFACQQMAPQFVWLPELQMHPNTARRLGQVEVLVADSQAIAFDLARQIKATVEPDADGALRRPTGKGRATLAVMDRACLAGGHPSVTLEGRRRRAVLP
jgi:hypothetical protein